MTRHVSVQIAGDGWTENGGLIGTAETADEALTVARGAGYEPADNIDEYDAEDAPRICGYEPDGLGAYVVAVRPRLKRTYYAYGDDGQQDIEAESIEEAARIAGIPTDEQIADGGWLVVRDDETGDELSFGERP